jgi:hypothetical protein
MLNSTSQLSQVRATKANSLFLYANMEMLRKVKGGDEYLIQDNNEIA